MKAILQTRLQCGGVNKVCHCWLIRLAQGSMFVRSYRQIFETFTVCLTRNRLSVPERELVINMTRPMIRTVKLSDIITNYPFVPDTPTTTYVTRLPEESYRPLSIRTITVIFHFDNGDYGCGHCRHCQSSQTRALLQRHSPVGLLSCIFPS
jgi:hypothetical protein